MTNKLLFISELIVCCLVKCYNTHHEIERKNISLMECIELLRPFSLKQTSQQQLTGAKTEKERELQYCKCRNLFLLDKFVCLSLGNGYLLP
jgi:hypothetical protein